MFPASPTPCAALVPILVLPALYYLFLQEETINPFFSSASKTILLFFFPSSKVLLPQRGFVLLFFLIFLMTQLAPLPSQLRGFIN